MPTLCHVVKSYTEVAKRAICAKGNTDCNSTSFSQKSFRRNKNTLVGIPRNVGKCVFCEWQPVYSKAITLFKKP